MHKQEYEKITVRVKLWNEENENGHENFLGRVVKKKM